MAANEISSLASSSAQTQRGPARIILLYIHGAVTLWRREGGFVFLQSGGVGEAKGICITYLCNASPAWKLQAHNVRQDNMVRGSAH